MNRPPQGVEGVKYSMKGMAENGKREGLNIHSSNLEYWDIISIFVFRIELNETHKTKNTWISLTLIQ